MFCPTCGGQFEGVLNYCKHCGTNLAVLNRISDQKPAERSTETLGWVIAGTSITLLGMALGALVLMKDNGIDPSLGKIFVMMSLVGFVLVEGVLVARFWQQSRKINQAQSPQTADFSTSELRQGSTPVLAEPGEPVSNIENSTRELEHSYQAKK